ncbi:MAG: FAD-dependent oxidoreductase, partial [Burkholderiales bacterium]
MNHLTRRDFGRLLTVAGTGAFLDLFGSAAAAGNGTRARVVVIGGGFAGATCANFLRSYAPQLEVTLVEPKKQYVTCPFSNTVIGGINDMAYITFDYGQLQTRRGCKIVQDRVASIDASTRVVRLQGGGTLSYDRLVLAPGIDFLWNKIAGHSQPASTAIPHAWNAGEQTQILVKQLQDMPDGGVVIIAAPLKPFRAPPAILERASLIAYYLTASKPKSKVLLLDPNDDEPKLAQFRTAWDELYPGMIERVSGPAAEVARLDVAARTLHGTSGAVYKGAVINLIPPQCAAGIAATADLTDKSGWCPVNPVSFESTLLKSVHVIGDACAAGEMPKTAFAANVQAKVCAAAIIASLNGGALLEPT